MTTTLNFAAWFISTFPNFEQSHLSFPPLKTMELPFI